MSLRPVRSRHRRQPKCLGFRPFVLQASTEHDLEESFSTLVQRGQSGIMISPDTFFSGKSAELAALALRHAVPTISPYREIVRRAA